MNFRGKSMEDDICTCQDCESKFTDWKLLYEHRAEKCRKPFHKHRFETIEKLMGGIERQKCGIGNCNKFRVILRKNIFKNLETRAAHAPIGWS